MRDYGAEERGGRGLLLWQRECHENIVEINVAGK